MTGTFDRSSQAQVVLTGVNPTTVLSPFRLPLVCGQGRQFRQSPSSISEVEMIPKTLSATSLHVAELCMARWEGEMYHRGKGQWNIAAMLGTTVHNTLEQYVKLCIMEGQFPATEKQLLEFFLMQYYAAFGSGDDLKSDENYLDGVKMLKAWFARTDFTGVEVVSVEVKENFPVQTSVGPVPLNYIWDRHDRLPDGTLKVVDYKTNRFGINPTDLKQKLQARIYALAAAIKYKDTDYKEIWVEFDMLRHDGPVGIVFTREDNAETWRHILRLAEKIIAEPEGFENETLNPECNFCPRKAACGALKRNILIGGVHSVDSEDLVDLRAMLEWQKKGITTLLGELDTRILAEAKEEDVFSFESDSNIINIGVSSRRAVDADRVELIVGEEIFSKFGGRSLTMGNLDKMLKSPLLTDEQKAQVRGMIYKSHGEPRVSVKAKGDFDE